jgi:hypothetical protein
MFQINKDVTGHNTRQSNLIHKKYGGYEQTKRDHFLLGSLLYNKLPDYLKNIESVSIFKKELFTYLIKKNCYSIHEKIINSESVNSYF